MTSLKISGLFPDTKVVLTDYLRLGGGGQGGATYGHPAPRLISSLASPPHSDLLTVMSDIVDGDMAILASNLE